MWQYIITFTILGAACYLAIRPLVSKRKSDVHDCSGCSSSCSGCPVMEIKSQMESASKK